MQSNSKKVVFVRKQAQDSKLPDAVLRDRTDFVNCHELPEARMQAGGQIEMFRLIQDLHMKVD